MQNRTIHRGSSNVLFACNRVVDLWCIYFYLMAKRVCCWCNLFFYQFEFEGRLPRIYLFFVLDGCNKDSNKSNFNLLFWMDWRTYGNGVSIIVSLKFCQSKRWHFLDYFLLSGFLGHLMLFLQAIVCSISAAGQTCFSTNLSWKFSYHRFTGFSFWGGCNRNSNRSDFNLLFRMENSVIRFLLKYTFPISVVLRSIPSSNLNWVTVQLAKVWSFKLELVKKTKQLNYFSWPFLPTLSFSNFSTKT